MPMGLRSVLIAIFLLIFRVNLRKMGFVSVFSITNFRGMYVVRSVGMGYWYQVMFLIAMMGIWWEEMDVQ